MRLNDTMLHLDRIAKAIVFRCTYMYCDFMHSDLLFGNAGH